MFVGGVCGECNVAGVPPTRSRLLDAPAASSASCLLSMVGMWNNIPRNIVRTCFGLLGFVVAAD